MDPTLVQPLTVYPIPLSSFVRLAADLYGIRDEIALAWFQAWTENHGLATSFVVHGTGFENHPDLTRDTCPPGVYLDTDPGGVLVDAASQGMIPEGIYLLQKE